ncbi:MAG: calcium-binding protein [Planctomycetaceae bacterium]
MPRHTESRCQSQLFSPKRSPFSLFRRASRASGRRSPIRTGAALESLETRAMLSAVSLGTDAVEGEVVDPEEVCEYAPEPTFNVDQNGVVTVGGTHNADVIVANVDASGLLVVTVNNVTFAVSDAQVTSLVIDAKCGDDLVAVLVSVQHPTSIVLGHGNDTAYALGGPSRVAGNSGNDLIVAGDYDDILSGGDGTDILLGGKGNDLLMGGNGFDGIAGGDGDDSIEGGPGNDIILGDGPNTWPLPAVPDETTIHEYLVRLSLLGSGNDRIDAGDGDDWVLSGAGNDRVYSGAGNDVVLAGTGSDWVEAGDGDDVVHGGADTDVIFGGAGNDIIFGAGGDDYVIGGSGSDKLDGGHGNDWIFGDATDSYPAGYVDPVVYAQDFGARGEGNDIIHGGWGHDAIFGGGGNDGIVADPASVIARSVIDAELIAGAAADAVAAITAAEADAVSIDARPVPVVGNDVVFGGGGRDRIAGNGGNDILVGGGDDDGISGGDGHDLIFGDGPNTLPRLLPWQVDISLRQYLQRAAGVNIGNDVIDAGAGNDLVYAGRGNDRVNGGSGNDTIFGGDGNDGLFGGDGSDTILGEAGNDFIDGGAGDDKLQGNAGNDTIIGGSGEDDLDGGAGADWLIAVDGEKDTVRYDIFDILFVDGIDDLILT